MARRRPDALLLMVAVLAVGLAPDRAAAQVGSRFANPSANGPRPAGVRPSPPPVPGPRGLLPVGRDAGGRLVARRPLDRRPFDRPRFVDRRLFAFFRPFFVVGYVAGPEAPRPYDAPAPDRDRREEEDAPDRDEEADRVAGPCFDVAVRLPEGIVRLRVDGASVGASTAEEVERTLRERMVARRLLEVEGMDGVSLRLSAAGVRDIRVGHCPPTDVR